MAVDTLAKLIEHGEAETDEHLTNANTEEVELIDDEIESEAVVAEDEEESEITLEGEQQDSLDTVAIPKKTLSKLRRQKREAKQAASESSDELARMREELNAVKKAAIKKPSYLDFNTEEDYDAAMRQYQNLSGDTKPATAPKAETSPVLPDFAEAVNAHYDRAEKLGINLDKFAQSEKVVRENLGDMATDALIDAVGVGSEKVVAHLGSNSKSLQQVITLLTNDPTGMKAVGHLNRMAERLKVSKKSISRAPSASKSPSGSATAPLSSLQKQYAKAEKSNDVNLMFKLRRQARKDGQKLD